MSNEEKLAKTKEIIENEAKKNGHDLNPWKVRITDFSKVVIYHWCVCKKCGQRAYIMANLEPNVLGCAGLLCRK